MANDRHFVFVNLAIKSGYYSVNHGIAFLVPLLQEASYRVSIVDMFHDKSEESFRTDIEELNPSIIGFSSTTVQLKYLIKYANATRSMKNVLKIAGGVGPSLSPEQFLLHSHMDGVVIGEGETPLKNLLRALEENDDYTKINGFYWRRGEEILRNSVSPFIENLDTIPFPDYSLYPREIVVRSDGTLKVMLSRGCPYRCSYCCNESLRSLYPSARGYFRIPSVDYSIGLLQKMLSDYPEVKTIDFQDDNLIANKKWFLEFADIYRARINRPYKLLARVDRIDDDILEGLRNSGCVQINIGLESGNETLRKEVLGRSFSNDLLIDKARRIRSAGIKLFTFNILGFPYETPEQMRETLELNQTIAADDGVCTFFYPFPKTRLYDVCKEQGLLKDEGEILNLTNYMNSPGIKIEQETEKICFDLQNKMMEYFLDRQLQNKLEQFTRFQQVALWPLYKMYTWMRGSARKYPILYFASFALAKIRNQFRSK